METPVLDFPRAKKALLARPYPPAEALEGAVFTPAPDLAQWARACFIEWGGALHNETHAHLETASLGFLWAGGLNEARGRRVLGTCELIGQGERKTWIAQRYAQQLRGWFGYLPEVLITIDAHAAAEMGDRALCALLEHELSHAGQACDEHGMPRFTPQGRPVLTLKPHDLEEFAGVAARYGAWSPALKDMAAALAAKPAIDDGQLWMACGTCRRAA